MMIRLVLTGIVGGTMLAAPAGSASPPDSPSGSPQVILCGQPAPPPSSEVTGLVLVAHDSGPQLLFAKRPDQAFMALEAGEDVDINLPLTAGSGVVVASVEMQVPETCEALVSLTLEREGHAGAVPQRWEAGRILLSARGSVGESPGPLRLRVRAGARPAVLQFRRLQVTRDGVEMPVSLWPGAGDDEICPPRVLPVLRTALETFLVEWDWRMQDGIETERAPRGYAEAIRRTLQRTRAHWAGRAGEELWVDMGRWAELEKAWADLALGATAEERQWEQLWRQVHQARRELLLGHPLLAPRPLAFIKQVPSMFSHQLTQYYASCARPGGGVYVLDQPGHSMRTRCLTETFPAGSFQHLEVSPDGRRLLFAYGAAPTVPKDREEHLDRFYHLYEMDVDGSGLRQLTQGDHDDFAPRYLPGGGLVFISTRRGGFHRCGRGPCPVYTLCVADGDGSNLRVISWHETHEWDPAVLHDGRIIYTRWDYVDRHAVFYQQLWTARPDGSGVRIFYGNNTFNPVGIWEARPVPGSHRVMATAGAHHAMTAGSIILIDPDREPDGPGPITRLTPDALFPESEAPVLQKPNGSWHAPTGVDRPPAPPPEAERWPGHCYRSPLPLAEDLFLAAYSYDSLIGEPTWNRANLFGLYVVDAYGNKELLYRDLNIASLWPAQLQPSGARPAEVSNPMVATTGGEGLFFLQDVQASWLPMPREPVSALRIVQVLPKSTPHANQPMVGLANASPGRQVLGTVPVEPDGSAFFQAPAGIPLAFQALDNQGRALQIMRSVVYLQPGEMMSCVGCHEHRTTAPGPGPRALALGRPPSRIRPAPSGSRPLNYVQLVQPVLDQHCVPCHQAGRAEGEVQLTGEPQGAFTVSYHALAPRVSYAAWGGKPGDFRQVNSEPASQPGFFGARGSAALATCFTAAHHQVNLSAEDWERVVTWMDANALFYGTFDPEDQARQLRGELIAGPSVE